MPVITQLPCTALHESVGKATLQTMLIHLAGSYASPLSTVTASGAAAPSPLPPIVSAPTSSAVEAAVAAAAAASSSSPASSWLSSPSSPRPSPPTAPCSASSSSSWRRAARSSSNIARRSFAVNGFVITVLKPAAMYRARSCDDVLPVVATSGIVTPAARSSLHNTSPPMPGITMSISMTSNGLSRAICSTSTSVPSRYSSHRQPKLLTARITMRRLMRSSSTMHTRRFVGSSSRSREMVRVRRPRVAPPLLASASSGMATGSSSENTVQPSMSRSATSPPMTDASMRQMGNPRPVPRTRTDTAELCDCVNGSNRRSTSTPLRPTPWFLTSTRRKSATSSSTMCSLAYRRGIVRRGDADTTTSRPRSPPRCLMALETPLLTSCTKRTGSTMACFGTPLSTRTEVTGGASTTSARWRTC
mmetsp:Transcript_7125/g.25386  ORF Transcript_7125/g.25386 Transcript_7125/m.25386 type:complete len:418 (+) Transcript_7125:114-1367(+)